MLQVCCGAQLRDPDLSGRLRMKSFVLGHTPNLNWLLFFATVLGAWATLFAMQLPFYGGGYNGAFGAALLASLCAPTTAQAGWGVMFLMWALMSAAMMAPTFVPTLKTYRDLTHTDAANGQSFAVLLGAYLAVWMGYSVLAASAQLAFARAGYLDGQGASLSWGLTAGLLFAAGIYQFSSLKGACLAKCRAPMTFFMQYWRPGSFGALAMGLRLGVVCVGCCWALMALGFVGGTMNLVWMGVATLLMFFEKLPQIGRYVTHGSGVLLMSAGVFSGLLALGF